ETTVRHRELLDVSFQIRSAVLALRELAHLRYGLWDNGVPTCDSKWTRNVDISGLACVTVMNDDASPGIRRLRSSRSTRDSMIPPVLFIHVDTTCTLISGSLPTFSTSPTICHRSPPGLKYARDDRRRTENGAGRGTNGSPSLASIPLVERRTTITATT